MRFSVYTSCAVNYLPKARALARSLRCQPSPVTITLCLCDRPPSWLDMSEEPFDQIWLPEDLGYMSGWIFEHNVMELCTAVKGRALVKLIDEAPDDLHLYFDPDVYVFEDIAPIADMMDGSSIGLVPHILAPEKTDIGVQITEMSVTGHGIYNLGHLVIKPDANGRAFADWWATRLDRYCFDDRSRGLFTDQRWVDLAPSIFDGVRILREPGLDVASWNLSHRDISQAGSKRFTANGKPLITYHFSGTGPEGTHRRVRESFAGANPAVAEIERLYEDAIAKCGHQQLGSRPSAYDSFDNGALVSNEARRLYRENGDLQRAFPDPYATGEGCNYLKWLQEHRPTATSGLRIPADRLERGYADLFDAEYYLDTYPQVAALLTAGRYDSALEHYELIGSAMLMDPNEFFVSSYYLRQAELRSVPVAGRGVTGREATLLWHYLTEGLGVGAEPVEFFSSSWYLAQNPDLEAALRTGQISSPLGHFLNFGSQENRQPGPEFNAGALLETSPSAKAVADQDFGRGAFGALVRLGLVAGRCRIPGET